mmetsp:Transcript_2122/g.5990  ORF Transcript_2122/g.5990 Transcript_2122/m.5990 type:complete len:830 (+) Transcript_2122:53-2542(+)
MLRSEEMTLCQLIDRNDTARTLITELGEAGIVQFRDMNGNTPVYKRSFADDIKRCDEMVRQVTFLHAQLEAVELSVPLFDPAAGNLLPPLEAVRGELKRTTTELKESKGQEVQVRKAHNALKEHLHVLQLGGLIFDGASSRRTSSAQTAPASLSTPLLAGAFPTGAGVSGAEETMLHVQTGTIPRALAPAFVRAVHRITRGNCIVHDTPIDEPLLGVPPDGSAREPVRMPKNFFMLVYSGSVMHTKVSKICTHFGTTLYLYPEALTARQALQARLQMQLLEMTDLVRHTSGVRKATLRTVAAAISVWGFVVEREKATLRVLNMLEFDYRRKVFVAEMWVPSKELSQLRLALRRAAILAGGETKPILNEIETVDTPPTFLRTNKFTVGFQGLVDTYGIPRYREVNPGAFAVILFPFLFAIMFGDVGHGALLVLLAVYFIANEKTLGKAKLEDIIQMVYGGRYVLLLNGLFAVYVGFIYNEAFSVPFGLFKSTWHESEKAPGVVQWDGTVYPFGVDPMWHMAQNKMTFFNSYKMKVSIIFGVTQMALGITLQLFNHLLYRNHRSIWFGFVPEIVFFLGIFGYLVFMILKKWSIDWVAEAKQPPSLLNTLIAMFMSPGKYTEDDMLYEGQDSVQLVLLVIAVLAVPLLLVPKPLLFYWDMQKAAAEKAANAPTAEAALAAATEAGKGDDDASQGEEPEEEEEGELGEVVVHQVIHTIEFVLGSISNTASYLRLWALSLAHSQLSELFWEKVMKEQAFPAATLPTPLNGIAVMFLFGTWVILNLGVLMVMENLSSFLHALRLQWVEFQNKFYNGDGYKFVPFSYANLLNNDQE